MYKMDIGKITALKKAGWGTEDIATEMHMESGAVDEVVSKYMETKKDTEIKNKKQENGQNKETSVIPLTSEQLGEICEKAAAVGAKEALKIFKQKREKEYSNRMSRRLRNTKLLLRNYHMLKEHAENSVFCRTQMEESAFDILESMMSMYDYDNEVIIESIKRSATRTAVIVSHIEVMLGLYKSYCEKSTSSDVDERRYNVLWDRYVSEQVLSVKEIAKKYNMSKENVYFDLKFAIEKVSALIFGVDGLKVQ